jgi:hypothetical protein
MNQKQALMSHRFYPGNISLVILKNNDKYIIIAFKCPLNAISMFQSEWTKTQHGSSIQISQIKEHGLTTFLMTFIKKKHKQDSIIASSFTHMDLWHELSTRATFCSLQKIKFLPL